MHMDLKTIFNLSRGIITIFIFLLLCAKKNEVFVTCSVNFRANYLADISYFGKATF